MLIIRFNLLWFCIVTYLNKARSFIDPLTAMGVVGVGLGLWNYDTIKKYTVCNYVECCIDTEIKNDILELENRLKQWLYGQHIVQGILIPALRAHLHRNMSKKPLVLSFHGTPGTGKNYVSDMIAEALFRKGLQSRFVRKFMGRADFPRSEYIYVYKKRIEDTILEALKECPQTLFIFDEVDKMPQGIFDTLTSVLNYNQHYHGQDLSKLIFIFLSNTAGVEISEHLGKLIMKDGILRENTKLGDFENILQGSAYNVEGGFHKSPIIEAHVIDHFIPFLPLEKTHLYQCVISDLSKWGIRKPSMQNLDEIIDPVVTYDPNYGIFAKSGCKKLANKVAVFAQRRNY